MSFVRLHVRGLGQHPSMRSFASVSLVLFSLLAVSSASAQNPAWPNTGATRAEMNDPANWPDDPNYGYDVRGDDTSCVPGGGRCWNNPTGGQWSFWSWTPTEALGDEFLDDADYGAGTWTDMAWTITTGDKRTIIAVLDSGIRWREPDLVNQYYINVAELTADGLDPMCLPTPPDGHAGDAIDLDGDGFLTMRDYVHGRTPEEAAAIRSALDMAGNGNGVAEPGDLITVCSDGVDDDGNGYIDDISGWDFHHNDNDPNDDTDFGHGTGEARWSAAETNNGIGRAGYCPGCRVLMVRVGDSFIVDAQDYGQSVVFSVDSGADIVQEALGSLNGSTFGRRSMDYAYDNDVLVIASAADENSRHHNLPGTANHNLYIHAVRYAGAQPQNSSSFVAFNNCTNYGGQLMLSGPGTGCSSESVGVGAGIAGLIYSAGRSEDRPGGPLDPPLSAEEVRQLMMMQADDIYIPESQPEHPNHIPELYPSREGWDQRFGHGRLNAYRSVRAAWGGEIPPEVDIEVPDWFHVLYPERESSVTIRGHMDARRAESFDWVIEWAPGIEPEDADFETLASAEGATEAVDGDLHTWDISGLNIDNDGEIENRYSVTVRVRVTANYADRTVTGDARRVYAIMRDPSLLPGFPFTLGVQEPTDLHPGASGEASAKLADIDGDDRLDIIYPDADGLVHVIRFDGTEVPGFPVHVSPLRGVDAAVTPNFLGSRGYASGDVVSADLYSSNMAPAAVGDLDDDGEKEIIVASSEGDIFVFQSDGTVRAGFPVGLPEVLSGDPLRMGPTRKKQITERGIFGAPTLADLDSDGSLEIVIAGFDGHVHVFREDGAIQSGFPVRLTAPELWMDAEDASPGRIMTSPTIGDADGDGILDIALGSNEVGDDANSGAIHLIHGDGNDHPGGASHDNWPVRMISLNLFPFVGEGTPSSVAMANVTGDDRPELAITGTASNIFIIDGVQPARGPGEPPTLYSQLNSALRGPLSDISDSLDRPLLNTFASGSFTDWDADGVIDYSTGGAGLRLAQNLGGGYENKAFSHQLGMWTTAPVEETRKLGPMMEGFPRRVEDYMFFTNPTSADVNGDGYPEVLVGTGGYYLHAFDACGREAEGFPKFTGSWIISSPAAGDVDGDGLLEVVVTTRLGYMYVFDTEGPAPGVTGWPEIWHDNFNTGNYDMPLSNGGERVTTSGPLECDIPVRPDAGTDAGVDGGADAGADSGADAGVGDDDDGCGCHAPGAPADSSGWLFALLFVGVLVRRKR